MTGDNNEENEYNAHKNNLNNADKSQSVKSRELHIWEATSFSEVLTSDVTHDYPVGLESIPQLISSNTSIPSDKAIPNSGSWSVRPNLKHYGPFGVVCNEQAPQSSSPILSQHSSPSSSRATSPNRISANIFIVESLKDSSRHVRRPSLESAAQSIVLTHHQITNEIHPQNIDDVLINTEGSMSQLHSLIRNGFGRNATHHRNTSGKILTKQQQPLNQQHRSVSHGNFSVNSTLAHSMQSLSLTDKVRESKIVDGSLTARPQNACVESDSGSSLGSCGETSPRETPDLSQSSSHGADIIQPTSLQKTPLVCLNTQVISKRSNETFDKKTHSSLSCSQSSAAVIFDSPGFVKSQIPPLQQQFSGTDQVLATGTPLLQSPSSGNSSIISVNNTNSGPKTVSAANIISANNKIVNTILMSSSSDVVSCGILGNIVTSNSLLNQQQYSASYTYHVAAPQHLTSAARSPVIPHNPGIGPPPLGSLRVPAFQIPHNGEIIYPGYHSAGIAYIPNGPVSIPLRSSASSNVNQQISNTPQGNPLQHQKQQIVTTPNAAHLAASPFTSLTIGVNKPISCYNCGSQSHNGRDCHEASMDDVSRNVVYKLDYSVSSSNTSPSIENQSQSTSHIISSEKSSRNIQQKQNIISLNDMDAKVLSTSTSTISP